MFTTAVGTGPTLMGRRTGSQFYCLFYHRHDRDGLQAQLTPRGRAFSSQLILQIFYTLQYCARCALTEQLEYNRSGENPRWKILHKLSGLQVIHEVNHRYYLALNKTRRYFNIKVTSINPVEVSTSNEVVKNKKLIHFFHSQLKQEL